jgi:hypothetical protein
MILDKFATAGKIKVVLAGPKDSGMELLAGGPAHQGVGGY